MKLIDEVLNSSNIAHFFGHWLQESQCILELCFVSIVVVLNAIQTGIQVISHQIQLSIQKFHWGIGVFFSLFERGKKS
jgi:hypothetical protein